MTNYAKLLCILCPLALSGAAAQTQTPPPPIIDMHLHAHLLSDFGGGMAVCTGDQKTVYPGLDPREPLTIERAMACPSPLATPATDEALMRETLEMLERYNIRAVTSGSLEQVSKWRAVAPDRIIPALSFATGRRTPPAEFRRLFADGKFAIFAEVGAQYRGLSPADKSWEPYFTLAEKLDIPVGIHLGEGPPGGPHTGGDSTYRARLTSPYQLEEVLIRHPKLRIYVMHYGSPLVDEMISMLFSHPQLYVDIAGNDWLNPRKQFYEHLRKLVEAGFEKRILWGSDNMVWPQAIPKAIESIEQAEFLTEAQKRDIFYANAARFLRLTPEEIARHHSK